MSDRDPDGLAHFIERFALDLTAAGVPRMPARVFAGLLATDSGTLTAAELADMLQISPASVSTAVRYLDQINLATREREPGSRRDHYRVEDDLWYQMFSRRDEILARWVDTLHEGIAVLGRQTPSGRRMAETLAFFEFLQQELPLLNKRWHERRDQLHRQWAGDA